MSENVSDGKNFPWINHIGTLVTLGSILCLCGSVLYLYGFTTSIGLSPSKINFTLADISRTTVLCAPIILGTLIGLVITIDISKKMQNEDEDTGLKSETTGKTFNYTRLTYFLFASMALALCVWGGIPLMSGGLLAAAILLSTAASSFAYSKRLGFAKYDIEKRVALQAIMVLMLSYNTGYVQGSVELTSSKDTMFRAEGKSSFNGRILMVLENGYLINSDAVEFYNKDEIVSISYAKISSQKVGLPCLWWGKICPNENE